MKSISSVIYVVKFNILIFGLIKFNQMIFFKMGLGIMSL